MCQIFRINQTAFYPSDPTRVQKIKFHENYIKKRLEGALPDCVPTKQLFEEIKTRGYQGTLRTVQRLLSKIKEKNVLPEKSLRFYKTYLQKRVKEAGPCRLSTKQLFEEITVRGYRGAFSTMQRFLSAAREGEAVPLEASLHFHKRYLRQRLEENLLSHIRSRQLFEEIKARGYRGNIRLMRSFLSMIRTRQEEVENYLKERLAGAKSESISSKQLLEEITARGYRGDIRKMRALMATLPGNKKMLPEASLCFHKDYLKKRCKNTRPSGKQLFEEITAKGYRGTLRRLQTFLQTIPKGKKISSEKSLE